MAKVAIKLIKFYQYFSRSLISHNALPLIFLSGCRHYPTCSDYTIEAIQSFGLRKGIFKGIIRVLRCNPLSSCLSTAKRAQ